MKYLPLLLALTLGGCATVEPGKPMPAPPVTTLSTSLISSTTALKEADALQTLSEAGLAEEAQYESAQFIEGSQKTMIIASVLDVPCKMVFRHVKAANGDFWMPNQIACENQDSMEGFAPSMNKSVISAPGRTDLYLEQFEI